MGGSVECDGVMDCVRKFVVAVRSNGGLDDRGFRKLVEFVESVKPDREYRELYKLAAIAFALAVADGLYLSPSWLWPAAVRVEKSTDHLRITLFHASGLRCEVHVFYDFRREKYVIQADIGCR